MPKPSLHHLCSPMPGKRVGIQCQIVEEMCTIPKAPGAHIVYTEALQRSLYRYFRAKSLYYHVTCTAAKTDISKKKDRDIPYVYIYIHIYAPLK